MPANAKHPLILRITCYLVVVAWLALFTSIILFLYGLAFHTISQSYVFDVFSIFVTSAIASIVLGTFNKCPRCGEYLLLEKSKDKHAAAYKIRGIDYWASAVVSMVLKNSMICMYCGTKIK